MNTRFIDSKNTSLASMAGLSNDLVNKYKFGSPVEILEFAENGFYDELLSNNIVFLDRSLVDAMGVNAMGANAMGTVGDSTKK